MNCVANGKLLRAGIYDRIWVQPAAGDAGGAVGAALAAHHIYLRKPRPAPNGSDGMQGAYLGPEYPQSDIERRLQAADARFAVLSDDALMDTCARELASNKALGWHQGRMEFGPRALGARSILGKAAQPQGQVPVVLIENVGDWNTSFNVRGEPIVSTPEDAFRCFMGTEIECLAVGNCFLRKDEQNPALRQRYEGSFEPD